jgi:hypothetical protein
MNHLRLSLETFSSFIPLEKGSGNFFIDLTILHENMPDASSNI